MHDALSRFARLATFVLQIGLCASVSAQSGPQTTPPADPGTAQQYEPPAALPVSEADLNRARALFAEGLEFVAQQDWARAAERFTEMRAIRSSPVVSYNLASALAELGQLVESSKLLTDVLSDEQADAETRRAAQLLASKIEPHIGTLSISVYGNLEGCRFELDDRPIELIGSTVTLRVDAGAHRITVEREGETILSPQVSVGNAFPLQVQLSLEIPQKARPRPVELALPPPRRAAPRSAPVRLTAPPPPERDDESVFEQWWLWAGAGAVVAGAVVGTLVLTASDDPSPIAGNTDPQVIRTRVTGEMP